MEFNVILEPAEEGGFTAQCIELPAAISEGETKEETMKNIKEAIELVLEVRRDQGVVTGELVKVEIAHV